MPRRRFIRRFAAGAAAGSLLPSLARAVFAPHAGGEEWRDLDRGPDAYDSAASASALRAARARIREVRMRDWSLRFIDSAGRPRRGLEVEVFLTRHDFPFGDQVWPLDAWARDGKWEGERARAGASANPRNAATASRSPAGTHRWWRSRFKRGMTSSPMGRKGREGAAGRRL